MTRSSVPTRRRASRSSASPKLDRAAISRLKGDWVLEDAHDYRIDRATFTLYLDGEEKDYHAEDGDFHEPGVEYQMANRFRRNLSILSSIDSKRSILVDMSTNGGYWEPGVMIMEAMLSCPNPITILNRTWARSMSSMIFIHADRAVMMPNSMFMFHHGTVSFDGLKQEWDTYHEELKRSTEKMLNMYVHRLKKQGKFRRRRPDTIREILETCMTRKIDVWLTASEAVKWGFADAVFDGDWNNLRITKKTQRLREF
jgi:ATP-dependent protease ClpP protease subunit